MKVIWKYKLEIKEEFELELPINHEVLHVAIQHNEPHMWCLVDPDGDTDFYPLHCIGTGWEVSPKHDHYFTFKTLGSQEPSYIGTVTMGSIAGPLVWHFFKGIPKEVKLGRRT